MQCFIDSIILTISLVLKLLSFCGFRALFLLLLQIKFPQWFVSFERQKMCVGYKICARACLLVCVSEQTYFCVSPWMHALWMFAHLLIVIPVHMCILCSFMSRLLIFVHVCLHTFEDRYMFAGLVIFMLVCVCVWSRSDFYLYQSCIISSLFKHCLLCMSWNKIQFCVCKVSFFPI